mgnify:CR=1 FL=1
MRVASGDSGPPRRLLRRPCCVRAALHCLCCVSGCGGGGDRQHLPPSSTPTPAPAPAPGTTPAARRHRQRWSVGTALSIDSGASGNPVSLRVARSANGDGFAVWRGRRLRHASSTSGPAATAPPRPRGADPINIRRAAPIIDDFDLTVDASGNAVVVWHGGSTAIAQLAKRRGDERALRLTGAGAWSHAGTAEHRRSCQPRVASRCHRRRARRVRALRPSSDVFAGASSTLPVAPGSRKLRSSRTKPAPASASARRPC